MKQDILIFNPAPKRKKGPVRARKRKNPYTVRDVTLKLMDLSGITIHSNKILREMLTEGDIQKIMENLNVVGTIFKKYVP